MSSFYSESLCLLEFLPYKCIIYFKVGQFEGQAERLNFGLVRVVYEWALEKPFAEIIDLTDVQEGIIVRCIQQLHEVSDRIIDIHK